MYLYLVETCLTSQIDSLAEFLSDTWQLILAQAAHNCRTIQIKSVRCSNRNTSANCFVTHVAAVSQLNTGSCALTMNAICKVTQAWDYLRFHNKLTIEAKTALHNSSIGNSGHAHSSTSHTGMIIIEHLRRHMSRTHTLECRTTNGSIAKC